MAFFPKVPSGIERIDFERFPPRDLIASLMKLPMVAATERDGELIADLKTNGSWLSKAQMMGIGGLPPADQTWL